MMLSDTTNAQLDSAQTTDERTIELLKIIAKAGNDSGKALEELFRMFASRMRSFFKKHRISDEDASDLLQETFIKIHRSAYQFNGDSKASTWLWTIARNCMLDQIRGKKDHVSLDSDTQGEALDIDALLGAQALSASQQDLSRDEDIRDCVSRHFGHFARESPDRAATIQLAVIEGWSMDELATYLKRSPAATREYLSQCRKKLRDYLLPCADLISSHASNH
jgi:RNA polymerase sigma factor (sigma-70 family)